MAMFTVYVDDSGTHDDAKVAAAGCCVSSIPHWKRFERDWIAIEKEEEFEHFHMSAFAACRPDAWCRDCRKGKTTELDHPWREWSSRKRKRVLTHLISIVCRQVQFGTGWAIIKKDYNRLVPPILKAKTGAPYTYAFSCCGGQLHKWRNHLKVTKPMEYVFDLMPHRVKEAEIASLFIRSVEREEILPKYGMVPQGFSFKSKKLVRQLLSADMLAWATVQELLHATGIRLINDRETKLVCGAFEELRNRKFNMGYQTYSQLENWVKKAMALRAATGRF